MALVSQEPQRQIKSQKGRAAKVRLAGLEDTSAVTQLLSENAREDERPKTPEEVEACIESGGALLFESSSTLLCALLWRETSDGWTLEQPTVSEPYRKQELDRWVLTKVEALAIQRNIPLLRMKLGDESLLPYYERMGYRLEGDDLLLSKRVGGTWQYK